MAGVTRESIDRMAVQTAYNVLSVFDGKPIRENAVNPERYTFIVRDSHPLLLAGLPAHS